MKRTLIALALSLFAVAVLAETKAAPSADAQRETIARDLLTNFTAGKFDAAAKDFDKQMLDALPPAKLAEVAKQLEAQLGKFKSAGAATASLVKGYNVVTLASEYEKAKVDVQVVFDGEGKVAGLFFKPAA